MSHYSRPPRQAQFSGAAPTNFHGRRRGRNGAGPAADPGAITLERVAHPEALIAAYDRLAARGGRAPGRDGVTYADLSRGEVCAALRELARTIGAGAYRPAPSRSVLVPKADRRRRRELRLRGILDRVVSAALDGAMQPAWEPTFMDQSHGFRPLRGVGTLLAALEAAIAHTGRTVLAQDDVRDAFPSVVIADLLEDHREHIHDPRLLTLIEAVVRGGDDPGLVPGIAQGDPYSPTCLNVRLHATHDAPLARAAADLPWFRYADNLVYLAGSMPEGQTLLGHARDILRPAGFALKGADGPPIDLREGEAQLLGFRLAWSGSGLRLRPGDGAWAELARHLEEAHAADGPDEAARRAVLGWAAAYGPAFATSTEDETLEGIHAVAATQGFRELAPPEDLRTRLRDAHRRWQDLRGGALGVEVGRTVETFAVGRSAPTIAPGVPY